MAGRDDDKTVFGGPGSGGKGPGKDPDARPASGPGAGRDQPGAAPFSQPQQPAGRGDRTVIGGGFGQPPQPGQPPAPPGGQPGYGAPPAGPAASPFGHPPQPNDWSSPQGGGAGGGNAWGQPQPPQPYAPPPPQQSGNTWLGGPLSPQPPQPGGYGQPGTGGTGGQGWDQPPAQPPYNPGGAYGGGPGYPPPYQPGGYPGGQPGWPQAGHGIGAPVGQERGFFPDVPRDTPRSAPMVGPKISLQQAMRVKGLGRGSSSNPILAAAAPLLILLGRLRTGLVEMQAAPLMDHVTREIDTFERNLLAAGVNPHEAAVSKYILSGTADDIVQNLPGADRGDWLQYSMVARFFGKRDSGVGFFQEAEKAMQAPGQNYNLLELILTCLSLGFEGQYRTLPNGAVDLARIRSAIYETLRRVNARPDEDISPIWAPVSQGKRRRFAAVSIPAVLGIAAIAVVGFYATLSTLINRDGAQAAEVLRTLHPGGVKIALERSAPGPAFVADIAQLERVRSAFADEIAAGQITVDTRGDYISIGVGNELLFGSAAFAPKPEFAPLAGRIAQVLNEEGGPVLVQGFTDNVPMSGRGQFKTNADLSLARAEGVRRVLAESIDDASRMTPEGKGEADPVAPNDTPEGRARNRRVEILLAREGTY